MYSSNKSNFKIILMRLSLAFYNCSLNTKLEATKSWLAGYILGIVTVNVGYFDTSYISSNLPDISMHQ